MAHRKRGSESSWFTTWKHAVQAVKARNCPVEAERRKRESETLSDGYIPDADRNRNRSFLNEKASEAELVFFRVVLGEKLEIQHRYLGQASMA